MSRRVRNPSSRCVPVPEWPASDRMVWETALSGDKPDQSLAARWSDQTRRMVISGYGRWLTWLQERCLLDTPMSPAARVTPEHVSLYIADLRNSVGEFTVAVRVEQLGNAMRAMAPELNWHWMQSLADRIRAAAKAARKRPGPPSPQGQEPPTAAVSPATTNRCLPLAEWPALDQAAWAAGLQPGDVLDPGGIAAGWAVATQGSVINGYGRWLTWQTERGLLDPQLPPAARTTPERLLAYAEDLGATVAPFTVAVRIEQVGNAMRAMAPQDDWRWIQRAADRLRARAVSVRDKRARLQSPEQLVALGLTLMAQADDPAHGPPAVRAASCRDGLLIALLAHRPMRGRNLASILCDQNLVRRGTDWWLVFPAAETKTRQALEFSFPPDLVPGLHRYLEHHRPVLLARGRRQSTPVNALWISKQGTHMGYAAIGHQVRQRTAAAFGRALSPHLFRDCAATAIAINAPAQMQMIRSLLGHATLATSERHYNLAGSIEAGRRYGATIKALRT